MAGFNYGYARNKMEEQEFVQIAKVCRAEGIPEDTIELIHRILLEELNSDRRYCTHTQSYDALQFPDGKSVDVDNNPLMDKYLDNFSVPEVQIWEWGGWIEDLDTPEIVIWVRGLSEQDILLLELLAMDDLNQAEIAKVLGKHESAISRKVRHLRESLAKVLPEKLRKQYIR